MKKLLESGDDHGSTPVQSRKAVVPEKASPEKLFLHVHHELQDESLARFAVARIRSDGSKVQGTLLIGRQSVSFVTDVDEIAFSHSYLCLQFYEQQHGDTLSYSVRDNKVSVIYRFELLERKAQVLYALDEKIASLFETANDEDQGRKSRSGGRSRSSSVTKVSSGRVRPFLLRWDWFFYFSSLFQSPRPATDR